MKHNQKRIWKPLPFEVGPAICSGLAKSEDSVSDGAVAYRGEARTKANWETLKTLTTLKTSSPSFPLPSPPGQTARPIGRKPRLDFNYCKTWRRSARIWRIRWMKPPLSWKDATSAAGWRCTISEASAGTRGTRSRRPEIRNSLHFIRRVSPFTPPLPRQFKPTGPQGPNLHFKKQISTKTEPRDDYKRGWPGP